MAEVHHPGDAYQQDTPSAESRNWAMGAHVSGLSWLISVPGFVGPLIIWLLKRDDDPYVAASAREALNFQLTWAVGALLITAVVGLAAAMIAIATLGLGLIVIIPLVAAGALAWLAWLSLTVIGAVKAANGEAWRYPLTLRLVN